jgi:hypothetical protein
MSIKSMENSVRPYWILRGNIFIAQKSRPIGQVPAKRTQPNYRSMSSTLTPPCENPEHGSHVGRLVLDFKSNLD